MQKMSAMNDSCPRRYSTECEVCEGVQTYMGITENTLEEVHFERGDLLELIVSPSNMNAAYKRVVSNGGSGELDKCLEARGHRFVRYADDCMIFCKSRRAAERVRESITKFVEGRLLLKVNREKTAVGYARGVKYLGYSFYKTKGGWRLSIHPKSVAKIRGRLKVLTGRSNGMGYVRRKQELHSYIRGIIGYFHLADMKNRLLAMDEWLRRRIRMCLWKSWKLPRTREKRLLECGIKPFAVKLNANYRIKYWRAAKSHVVHAALSNEWLRNDGYPCLMDYYVPMHRN